MFAWAVLSLQVVVSQTLCLQSSSWSCTLRILNLTEREGFSYFSFCTSSPPGTLRSISGSKARWSRIEAVQIREMKKAQSMCREVLRSVCMSSDWHIVLALTGCAVDSCSGRSTRRSQRNHIFSHITVSTNFLDDSRPDGKVCAFFYKK